MHERRARTCRAAGPTTSAATRGATRCGSFVVLARWPCRSLAMRIGFADDGNAAAVATPAPGLRPARRGLRPRLQRPAHDRRRGRADRRMRRAAGSTPPRRRRRASPPSPRRAQRGRRRPPCWSPYPDDLAAGRSDRAARPPPARRRAPPTVDGTGAERLRRRADRGVRSTCPTASPSGCRCSSAPSCCCRSCC